MENQDAFLAHMMYNAITPRKNKLLRYFVSIKNKTRKPNFSKDVINNRKNKCFKNRGFYCCTFCHFNKFGLIKIAVRHRLDSLVCNIKDC